MRGGFHRQQKTQHLHANGKPSYPGGGVVENSMTQERDGEGHFWEVVLEQVRGKRI